MFLIIRYLTRLQMVQFIMMILHGMLPMYYDCGYPKIMPMVRFWFLWSLLIRKKTTKSFQVIVGNAATFLILFANFYFFAYVNKKKSEEKKLK